jgi:uncharacterized membrane protein YqjE
VRKILKLNTRVCIFYGVFLGLLLQEFRGNLRKIVANERLTTNSREPPRGDLAALLARLTDQLSHLFEARLTLLKIELKEEANAYLRGAVMIVAGSVVAIVGFALLNVAIAFFISILFEATRLSQPAQYGIGFIITALLYLAVGAVLLVAAKNHIAKKGIVPPRTAAELKRDKEVLKQQI